MKQRPSYREGISMDMGSAAFAQLQPKTTLGSLSGEPPVTKFWSRPRVFARLVLSFVLFSQSSSADQLSIDEILKKVSETYQQMQSYHIVAEIRMEVAAVGEARSPEGARAWSNFYQSTSSDVNLAVVNPGKVRLLVKDERQEFLLVSDGLTTWTYMPKKKQYTEKPTAARIVEGQSRPGDKVETDILSGYESLLVSRFRDLPRHSPNFVLVKETLIKVGGDKIVCYVLKMETRQGTHEIWVDKGRFIVWRSKDSSPTAQEGITLQKTTTVNLKAAIVNTKLEDGLFTFSPPEKATRVQSLSTPMK